MQIQEKLARFSDHIMRIEVHLSDDQRALKRLLARRRDPIHPAAGGLGEAEALIAPDGRWESPRPGGASERSGS